MMNDKLKKHAHKIKFYFKSPSEVWDQSFPLGNGDLGAMRFWDKSGGRKFRLGRSFKYGINKIDIWDRRRDRREKDGIMDVPSHKKVLQALKKRDWDKLRDLRRNYHRIDADAWDSVYPCPKPAGELIITDLIAKEIEKFSENLSIGNGLLETRYEYASGKTRVSSFVSAEQNLLVIRYEDKNKQKPGAPTVDRRIELYRWLDRSDPTLGTSLSGCDDRHIWVDFTFPDGFRYVMMVTINGVDFKTNSDANSAWIKLKPNKIRFEIYLTVVTSRDSRDPLLTAKKILSRGVHLGYQKLVSAHKKWWVDFWEKSAIELPDKELEKLWYYHLYQLASCSRQGKQCPGLAGLWNRFDNPPWHGQYYTDCNIQMSFWPVYTANHPELTEPFYRLFQGMLPGAKKETLEVYGCSGVRIPFVTDETGVEYSTFPQTYIMSGGGRMGLLFWWHYLYTRDSNFLKKTAYPFLKEITAFYLDYLKKDNQGKYYIWPSVSPEQLYGFNNQGLDKNPTIDLAVIKSMLKACLEASQILNTDVNERSVWENYLKNLSCYPTGSSRNGRVIFKDTADAKVDRNLSLACLLAPIYPCDDIDQNSSPSLVKLAKNTLKSLSGRFSTHGHQLPWQALAAARLGIGDACYRFLKKLIEGHMTQNFFFSMTPQKDLEILQIDAGCAMAAAVNEMLLQSQNGLIQVFPAIPKSWKELRFFDLRARGAFLISAEMTGGIVKHIIIKSERGGPCRLKNPWLANSKVNLKNEIMHTRLEVNNGKIINFSTKRGHLYSLKPSRRYY